MNSSKKVHILYSNFYDRKNQRLSIGGVQTYITNLCIVILELEWKPIIYQYSDLNFVKELNQITIKGFETSSTRKIYKECLKDFDESKDILIFGSENKSVRTNLKRAVLIQHGISWDLPVELQGGNKLNLLPNPLKRFYLQYKVFKQFHNCKNKVCVDYNYLNWYRTINNLNYSHNVQVIPNFTNCSSINLKEPLIKKHRNPHTIKIVFARRFVKIRGVDLFIKIAEKLLKEFSNVEVTFAGEGPLEELVKSFISKNKGRAFLTSYHSKNSFEFHRDFHISIIPSAGSEGTSISLAEAMSAGCVVVASNVGGITNMIINNYNGILVNPTFEAFYGEIKAVIKNDKKRKLLASNGLDVANSSFSLHMWQKKWTNFLKSLK